MEEHGSLAHEAKFSDFGRLQGFLTKDGKQEFANLYHVASDGLLLANGVGRIHWRTDHRPLSGIDVWAQANGLNS